MARDLLTTLAQEVLLWVQPHGGQSRARRNAWSSMVRDTQRRAQRLEVERSLAAVHAAGRQTVSA